VLRRQLESPRLELAPPPSDRDLTVGAHRERGSGGRGVAFTLDSLPSTAYHVDLYGDPIYASSTGGGQGCGQGKTWLGSIKVTTDATGHADDEIDPTTPFVFVRATATQTNSSTSQTSPCKDRRAHTSTALTL
jgi:hypothetical protein